jgi:hypothetical protein
LARAAIGWVAKTCLVMLAVVAIFTLFFVWAFGHPLAWSVIGCLFAALPLAGLVLALGIGFRAAVAAGPGRLAVRFFGRWRVVDLGQVRAVRVGDQGPLGGFGAFGGFGGRGGFNGLSGFGGLGGFGGQGPRGPGGGGAAGRTLVFEDVHGGRVVIGVDALDAGLAAVVRDGLGPDTDIDAGAAYALGRGSDAGLPTGDPGTGASGAGSSASADVPGGSATPHGAAAPDSAATPDSAAIPDGAGVQDSAGPPDSAATPAPAADGDGTEREIGHRP